MADRIVLYLWTAGAVLEAGVALNLTESDVTLLQGRETHQGQYRIGQSGYGHPGPAIK